MKIKLRMFLVILALMLVTFCSGISVAFLITAQEHLTFTGDQMTMLRIGCFVCVAIMITFIFTTRSYVGSVLKCIYQSEKQMSTMSNKDYSSTIAEKDLNRRDEFGGFFRSIDSMQQSIGNTLKDITLTNEQLGHTIDYATEQTEDNTKHLNLITSSLQELSASFEETAAATEEIDNSSIAITNQVSSVSSSIKNSQDRAENVQAEALTIKNNAEKSKQLMSDILTENRKLLNDAIEKSKSIDEIHLLSDAILNIASETNLLSLNASIEAARAGENGKSFAVVAEQIKTLSESSQDTVSQIQSVVGVVVDSVNNLVKCSESLLKFVDEIVTADYDVLVNTGDKYYTNAAFFANVLHTVATDSQTLLNHMETIKGSIQDVTEATNECAKNVTNIATNVTEVDEQSNELQQAMEETKAKANTVIASLKEFKF